MVAPEQEYGGEDIGEIIDDIIKASAIEPGQYLTHMEAAC